MRIVDFDNLDQHKDAFLEADMAFSCLGTTRAKVGADGFVKVDYNYIVNAAKILKEHGQCKGFHLVTSSGRNIPFIIPFIASYSTYLLDTQLISLFYVRSKKYI